MKSIATILLVDSRNTSRVFSICTVSAQKSICDTKGAKSNNARFSTEGFHRCLETCGATDLRSSSLVLLFELRFEDLDARRSDLQLLRDTLSREVSQSSYAIPCRSGRGVPNDSLPFVCVDHDTTSGRIVAFHLGEHSRLDKKVPFVAALNLPGSNVGVTD